MPDRAFRLVGLVLAGLLLLQIGPGTTSAGATDDTSATLFRSVRVFDGRSTKLSEPTNVLVRGSRIAAIGPDISSDRASDGATVVQGDGRVLMPGLIDVHAHVMLAELPEAAMLTADVGYITLLAARSAETMLMHGFTSVRDAGGPAFGLKRAIDTGLVPGPRIWPSGAIISQTSGHGDFRLPYEIPAEPGVPAYAERIGATAIADGPDLVLVRVREQLRRGASQIKLAAGGGVSSQNDPLDVTQYSLEELRAAVGAAEDWGTYVMVHAYTPRAVRRAVEAGVRSIEHGQLLDKKTVKLLAKKKVWWSLQPFLDDPDANPKQEPASRAKQKQVATGTDTAYRLAIERDVKVAWGTDTLFAPGSVARMNAKLAKLTRWYEPGELLRIATGQNGELLAMSGSRSPYPGRVGVIEKGALADLILVDGDPLADISLIEDPDRHFVVIMKDGDIFKNALD